MYCTWLDRPKQIHKFDFCPRLIDRIIFIHLTALLKQLSRSLRWIQNTNSHANTNRHRNRMLLYYAKTITKRSATSCCSTCDDGDISNVRTKGI